MLDNIISLLYEFNTDSINIYTLSTDGRLWTFSVHDTWDDFDRFQFSNESLGKIYDIMIQYKIGLEKDNENSNS